MEVCCTKKETEANFDIMEESDQKFVKTNPCLEEDFEQLYDKMTFPNEETKGIWKKLNKFQYAACKGVESLELVEGDKSIPGETYYGYV